MNVYSLYDVDGRVFSVLSLQQVDQLAEMVAANGASGYVDGAVDGQSHYVRDGQVTPRPRGEAVLRGAWLSGLPVPSLIAINRKEYPCDEANIELEFDQPGKYRIVVRAWPYLDMEFDLENPPL
ncbi:hypothetical protein ACOTEK_26640 [Achromobacter xylosoxidans]|jgi:hypothetical protein|uniref:hypothetical protein n=1 Tax=Alcaligenes xylosoxydans xylosoxydans TaxID=85698 RepID=UPI0003D68397|nr:hypothetical protein [Achromobacter xylosoxidans]AHC49998.1 hypothetical protein AX27061_5544 [Achromobacter xylosoxidans NBRC 15126 = ATCC 27061]QKQ54204.1 hypothetical protein FOC83_15220 [Achromobacter xylosoxidans]QPR96652.1 hypothetical protein I6G72_08810 [Achromobacter xylosoxidans]QQE54952.1 hypothetical protein I6H41_18600 [Achromobacter xylosoxidans]QQV14596.1 hypothetical protein I6I48_01540 [Achromobacter xylosoxidans]